MNLLVQAEDHVISYEEALQYLSMPRNKQIDLGLGRMVSLLNELDDPQHKVNVIHIAGTNGKGSTLNYLSSIFQEAGYRVGLFTSPYIHKPNEQIKINGVPVSDETLVDLVDQLKPVVDKMEQSHLERPTEFEMVTAMAFTHFDESNVDIALLETGLGGRLDATNVVTPLVSVITTVGYDHMQFLGDTLEEIATEKSGIIKPLIPVISGCKQEEVQNVIKKIARINDANLQQLGENFFIKENRDSFSYYTANQELKQLKLNMLGRHQQENAALAIATIYRLKDQYEISERDIRVGLQKTVVPNRIEVVQTKPTIIYDGGHNPEGIQALAETLITYYKNKTIYILFCAMKDKKLNDMLSILQPISKEITLTTFKFERAMNPEEVHHQFSEQNVVVNKDWQTAYTQIFEKMNEDDVLVVTGSLYFLNEVRTKGKKLS